MHRAWKAGVSSDGVRANMALGGKERLEKRWHFEHTGVDLHPSLKCASEDSKRTAAGSSETSVLDNDDDVSSRCSSGEDDVVSECSSSIASFESMLIAAVAEDDHEAASYVAQRIVVWEP